MKPYYQKIEALAPHFAGRVSKLRQFVEDEPRFTGQFAGHKFELTYYRPEAQPPNFVGLKCYINSSSGLRIFGNSIPSKVLIDKKVVTGDPDLDQYNFYSNSPDEAKRYLLSRKAIMKQLPEIGWSMPSISRRSISIATNINHIINPEEISKALKIMIELKA